MGLVRAWKRGKGKWKIPAMRQSQGDKKGDTDLHLCAGEGTEPPKVPMQIDVFLPEQPVLFE